MSIALLIVNPIEGWEICLIPKDVKVTGSQDSPSILAALVAEAWTI